MIVALMSARAVATEFLRFHHFGFESFQLGVEFCLHFGSDGMNFAFAHGDGRRGRFHGLVRKLRLVGCYRFLGLGASPRPQLKEATCI
jgi:hypothetical protein